MRVNQPQAPSPIANTARSSSVSAYADGDASSSGAKRVTATASDTVNLSPEARIQWGQSKLEESVRSKLMEQFSAAGVDLNAAAGQDWSVDATAQRIFDFSAGLYGMYRAQNPDLSEEEAVSKFEGIIRGGVDKGFGEAMEVLSGIGASDDILSTAKTTIDKVHTLFDNFFTKLRSELAPKSEE